MERYFLDTSALVKRYHVEVGTEKVKEIFERKERKIFISDLAIIEFHSALAKKVRIGELSKENFKKAVSFFLNEVKKGFFVVEEINNSTKKKAIELISVYSIEYSLRTLDALQLSVALLINEKETLDYFVTADTNLIRIVNLVGLKGINPEA